MAQPVADAGDARVVGGRHRVAFRLMVHGAELANPEWFSVLPDAPLHEKDGAFRVDSDEDGDDEQGNEKHDKPKECRDTVEAPLEEKPYFVFIFRHAAWPPY